MSSTPRWPVVLFDLDGTLINTIDVIVASYTYAWGKVANRQVTRAEILPWIGRTLADVFGELDLGHAAELEQVYMDHNYENLEAMMTGYDGVPELLTDLAAAGVRTGVVTSKRRRTAIPAMRLAGIPETTVLAVTMDDTDRHKPDPTPLLKGLAVVGAVAGESAYVGDAIHDLKAAHAAGMTGLGVTWGAGDPAELRNCPHEAVVDTVDQLRAVLLG